MRSALLALLLTLAACGPAPLALPAGGPPPSTFQTPPPAAAPVARPTAAIRGTVTP